MKLFMGEKILILVTAIVFDIVFGEYPTKFHPVIYMGFLGKLFDKLYTSKKNNLIAFFLGMFSLGTEVSLWIFIVFGVDLIEIFWLRLIIEIYLLKASFSIRALYVHVKSCVTDDESELRKRVSLIVSRDVSKLDKPHLYSAAIESLSENISDSITGPLFYYALFGLYGAMIYRVVNTYDALFGYRTPCYEWFGKFPARFDDLLNILPSRLTAMIILIFNPSRAWEYLRRYGGIKINATYPMSAFAGVLGVGFEKIGYYKFHGPLPEKHDVQRALRLYKRVVFVLISVVIISCMVV